MQDKAFCTLPACRLYDPKFHGWSVREVYNFLKQGREPRQSPNGAKPKVSRGQTSVTVNGKEYQIGALDEHDASATGDLTKEELDELDKKIDEAVRQGGMLAGLRGLNVPRGLKDAITPEVDWRAETADFMSSMARGKDEYTWRKFNPRRLADDYYMPSTYSEKLTELIIACDMSGSIGGRVLQEALGTIVSAAESTQPDIVRLLWWDTTVCSEQTFEGNYGGLLQALKPRGGGGTRVSCVSDYLKEKGYAPDCVLVITDGWVENNPTWEVASPTLWMVTGNDYFNPPAGQKVNVVTHG
jgi:predicted metal-dependent peptidase